MSGESPLLFVSLVMKDHCFFYRFDRYSAQKLLQILGQHAADRSLPLTWYGAALLSRQVRHVLNATE